MQTPPLARVSIASGIGGRAVLCLGLFLVLADLPASASGQAGQAPPGQRAPGQPKPAEAATGSVRVPTSHANVHVGPSTGQVLLVLAPKGTILKVTGRDKEWIQVELTPELRKTGMVMRWYRNETRGWMHDSTVEFVDAKPPGPGR
jgi:hypothetical protein